MSLWDSIKGAFSSSGGLLTPELVLTEEQQELYSKLRAHPSFAQADDHSLKLIAMNPAAFPDAISMLKASE